MICLYVRFFNSILCICKGEVLISFVFNECNEKFCWQLYSNFSIPKPPKSAWSNKQSPDQQQSTLEMVYFGTKTVSGVGWSSVFQTPLSFHPSNAPHFSLTLFFFLSISLSFFPFLSLMWWWVYNSKTYNIFIPEVISCLLGNKQV